MIALFLDTPSPKILEIKVNLQNPSSEILRENPTDDSDYVNEKFEGLLMSYPRNKNKSLAVPLKIAFENSSLVTPQKIEENSRGLINITEEGKKNDRKALGRHFKSNISPFLRQSLPSHPKNYNSSSFIHSEPHHINNGLLPQKSISVQEDSLINNRENQKNSLTQKNKSLESPDIKEFYNGISFPESKKNAKSLSYCSINSGKANLVYYMQARISNHSKIGLDRRFARNLQKKIEENFESEELSEGISDEFSGGGFCHFYFSLNDFFLEKSSVQGSMIEKSNKNASFF